MKAYVVTTGVLFTGLALVHIARILAEGSHAAKDPWFILTTVAAAGMSFWALRLLRRPIR